MSKKTLSAICIYPGTEDKKDARIRELELGLLDIQKGLPFSGLSAPQLERLAILSEECGEVVKAIGKILRHGYKSVNPKKKDKKTNRRRLEEEVADVLAAVKIMTKAGDLCEYDMILSRNDKLKKIKKYLHHN